MAPPAAAAAGAGALAVLALAGRAAASAAGGAMQQTAAAAGLCQLPLASSAMADTMCGPSSSAGASSSHDHLALGLAVSIGLMVAGYCALVLKVYTATTRGMARWRALQRLWPSYKETQAEVVMCLRGGDATLVQLFEALARQTHRAWHLRIVVDSAADPGASIAAAAIARLSRGASWQSARVEPLAERAPAAGSLKCAALRQALTTLHPETAVVVGVDGDAVIQPSWLISLIAEVQQPGVGAASGNRWFEPARVCASDGIRSVWGFAGVAVMESLGVPWGGSLAVRREVVEGSTWVKSLETTFCEDTALAGPLRDAGWRYVWAPAIVSIDTDPAGDFVPVARWLARQLLCAHMHHPTFGYTLTPFAIAGAVATAANAVSAIAAAAAGAWPLARMLIAAFIACQLSLAALATAEREVLRRCVLKPLGMQLPRGSGRRWLLVAALYATPTVLVSGLGSLWCLFARRVEWRNVVYARRGSKVWITERKDGIAVKAAFDGACGDAAPAAAAAAASAAAAAKGVARPLVIVEAVGSDDGASDDGAPPADGRMSVCESEADRAEILARPGSFLTTAFCPAPLARRALDGAAAASCGRASPCGSEADRAEMMAHPGKFLTTAFCPASLAGLSRRGAGAAAPPAECSGRASPCGSEADRAEVMAHPGKFLTAAFCPAPLARRGRSRAAAPAAAAPPAERSGRASVCESEADRAEIMAHTGSFFAAAFCPAPLCALLGGANKAYKGE